MPESRSNPTILQKTCLNSKSIEKARVVGISRIENVRNHKNVQRRKKGNFIENNSIFKTFLCEDSKSFECGRSFGSWTTIKKKPKNIPEHESADDEMTFLAFEHI